MRVLFITNRFPGLLMRGDQLRAYQQIRRLASRHAITLLSFGAPEGDRRGEAELNACCERVVVAERHPVGMAWRTLIGLFDNTPLQVAAFDAVPAAARLDALLQDSKFDLAHVQLARLGPMLSRLHPLPCVLDLVDALSVNMARRARLDRGPMGHVARLEASRLVRYERALCAQARSVAISSGPDRDAIGVPNIHLLGNGVDLDHFTYSTAGERASNLVFIGNLGYFPNVDAARWLTEQVLPLLIAQRPEVRLRLVGARPVKALQRLAADDAHVELVGPVPDVHPYLMQAAVALVPLRSGSGQQLKLLEAMAAGTPVVASSLSATAINAVANEHLLVADTAEDTAAAILRLLTDADLAARLAKAGRALVEREHSWDSAADKLERLWVNAAAARHVH